MMQLYLSLADATVPWNTVIWAIVVVVFLVLFRAPLSTFLERLSQLTFKANKNGVELTFDANKAKEELTRAVESKPESRSHEQSFNTTEIAKTIEEAAPRSQASRFSRSEVLWVDDRPDNNVHERKAFEAIGLRFTLARSTDEALGILKDNTFAAIISDMGRPPDPRAGYTLLNKLRHQSNKTPFIIYAGSSSPEHKAETAKHDGQGHTNHPEELFRLVTKAVIENYNT